MSNDPEQPPSNAAAEELSPTKAVSAQVAPAEPALEDPALAGSGMVDPLLVDAVAVDSTCVDPVAGDPASGDLVAMDPAPGDPASGDPVAVEPTLVEAAAARLGFIEAAPGQAMPAQPKPLEAAALEPAVTEPAKAKGEAEAPASAALCEPDEDSLRLAEALIFASAEPVTPRGLARVLADEIDPDAVLAALRARYAGRGVELVDAGPGVMFRSALDLAPRLRKVIESPRRLPRVAMETLAIVAYHQPVTRAEIEHIRGTALSQQTLDSLLELNLIAPKGRRETPGRPTLWGTTPEFLTHFGLKDLRELPRRDDLLLDIAPPRPAPEVISTDLRPPPG